jgi:Domain of unknown function (DUF4382)
MRLLSIFLLFSLVVAGLIVLISCSGGSGQGTVNTSLSDPSTCSAPSGPFRHIYVTVTDVLINQSADAGANDSGWVDLASGLNSNPVQVDLLGVSSQCFLSMLGSAGVKAGSYEQIRVMLAANSASVANNKCGSFANCVMLTSDPSNTPVALQLSSESQTGIKIPSGQIAGGKFTVGTGETKDLNIDFNACASIVVQGNGQYRLKPVLHAGEVTVQSAASAISGTVIDGSTKLPVAGGNTIVALEQVDSNNVDRVVMEGVADSSGNFSLCPVPDGTYDLVAIAINGSGTTYSATVITGVHPGDVLGTVPLTPAGLPASINGQVTTSNGTGGTIADLSISALQSIGNNVMITVPLAQQSAVTLTLTTGACNGTDCANYTLFVPAGNPSVGTFVSPGPQSPNAPAGAPFNYTVDAQAFVPGGGQITDCTPSDVPTSLNDANSTLSVTVGGTVNAATIGFTGCQ